MFFLAVITEMLKGQQAQKDGLKREYNSMNPENKTLVDAWFFGYDRPHVDIIKDAFGSTNTKQHGNSLHN